MSLSSSLVVYYGLYYCITVLLFILMHDHRHDLVLLSYSILFGQREVSRKDSFIHDSAQLACFFVTGSREVGKRTKTMVYHIRCGISKLGEANCRFASLMGVLLPTHGPFLIALYSRARVLGRTSYVGSRLHTGTGRTL
jgi:hypothetical protein